MSGIALRNAFDPEDLYLTVLLTEDRVPSKRQAGADASYLHAAVPRVYMNGACGQLLRPEADGRFSVTLETVLSEDWKRGDCHVVAIAHRNLKNEDFKDRRVITAETAPLGFDLGSASALPQQPPRILVAEDGHLTVLGVADAIEIYGADGAFISDRIDAALTPGVYVVRIFSNLRVYASKVVVR